MAAPKTSGAHHIRLTVTDLERSIQFYTEVLGVELKVRGRDNTAYLHDGTLGLGLNTPWRDISDDVRRFDEARVGLDHVGFKLASPQQVVEAAEHLAACGIAHSGVKAGRIPGSTLVVFRDPDNIQLEYYYAP